MKQHILLGLVGLALGLVVIASFRTGRADGSDTRPEAHELVPAPAAEPKPVAASEDREPAPMTAEPAEAPVDLPAASETPSEDESRFPEPVRDFEIEEGPLLPEPPLVVGSEKAERYAKAIETRLEMFDEAVAADNEPATNAWHLATLAVAASLTLEGRAEIAPPGKGVRMTPRYEGEYRFCGFDSVFSIDRERDYPFFAKCQEYTMIERVGGDPSDSPEYAETIEKIRAFSIEMLAALGH